MAIGRPKAVLVLTAEERRELESLAHRSRSAPALARRARLVFGVCRGRQRRVVVRRLRMSPATMRKWHARFVANPGHRSV